MHELVIIKQFNHEQAHGQRGAILCLYRNIHTNAIRKQKQVAARWTRSKGNKKKSAGLKAMTVYDARKQNGENKDRKWALEGNNEQWQS